MPAPSIRPIAGDAEIDLCARMMAQSEPWITLGRGYEAGRAMLSDAGRERHVAMVDGQLAGFTVVLLHGALVGYLQTICVAAEWRGQGVGRALLAAAEQLALARYPNLFLMVSDFNRSAQRFYEGFGYERIGALRDYLITGHSEILMRKTLGPIRGYGAR